MRALERVKRYDNYRKAVLIALPVATLLLVYLVSIGAEELFLSDWFISLISIPNFVAFQLGTAAYLGGFLDNLKKRQDKTYNGRRELIGTALGITIGALTGMWLISAGLAIPFGATLFAGASVLYVARQVNIFAGIGNRVGRLLDPGSRPMLEKAIVGIGMSIGLMVGAALTATGLAGLIGLAGVTTFISAGGAIPVWLAAGLFIITLTSGIGSTADYVAKSANFLKYCFVSPNDQLVKDRFHEYRGALVGVSVGLILAAITVTALALTQPALFTGVVGAIIGTLVFSTGASVCGSICSRTGRFLDCLPDEKTPPGNGSTAQMLPTLQETPKPTENTPGAPTTESQPTTPLPLKDVAKAEAKTEATASSPRYGIQ